VRASGILLHPTSLPGPFGIGDLGPDAYRFADFLARTGQRCWQVLPLGPTGYGNSPYMSFSAFGGNGSLVSPERLVQDGLLETSDLAGAPALPADRVDYARAVEWKLGVLRTSFRRFRQHGAPYPDDYCAFAEQNAFWLEDYALFTALKDAHGGRVWTAWEEGAARREPAALARWRNRLADGVQFRKYLQYLFHRQWTALRRYCGERGIRIIGDVPIYVAHDSAEVWANRELFHLDERGEPYVVAGVPPDYFSDTGQRWGNPIYRWDAMARTGFQWWIDRFRASFELADMLRLDHFRGFEAYWEIPASEPTAVEGRWVKGPGAALFESVKGALGHAPMIAEDLGVITPEVDALRDHLGYPGLRILQMAFGDDPKAGEYRPHGHASNCAVYTATHDHNTTVGWFTAPPGSESTQTAEEIARERDYALRYACSDGREIHWDFIRLALGSVAELAIFPLQDVLGLGTEARMNRPGTARGNWEWRFAGEALTPSVQDRLADLTRVYERGSGP
jgi:4-alpha-glucanotransferase